MKLFAHQDVSVAFLDRHERVFDMSDPGTGKTGVQIVAFARRRKKGGRCALVLAPKSLLYAAWAADFKKFAPTLKVSVATAKNRLEAFEQAADVYVTNVDAVKELLKRPKSFWTRFDTLIVDECDAFKHHTSARSKALAKLTRYFPIRRLMSGTPTANGICDLWHPMFLLDAGKRLGTSFAKFRSACCIPTQTGPAANMLTWTDKPGIESVVVALISDVTLRHRFETCVDIPPNFQYALEVTLEPKHVRIYQAFERESLAQIEGQTVSAINGAVLATKLLQIASGAVYDDDGTYATVATSRYELAIELAAERTHVVIFYLWEHQLEELKLEAERRELSYVVWDPDEPQIAVDFQAGNYRIIFCHPASAAHGLTLTRGIATIWPSPTVRLDWWLQGLKRIHRISQTEKTETIVLVAPGTIDQKVWAQLQQKKMRMDELFSCVEGVA